VLLSTIPNLQNDRLSGIKPIENRCRTNYMKAIILISGVLMTSTVFAQLKLEPFLQGIVVKNADRASIWYAENLGFERYKKMVSGVR
jgi:hypothetical protein